MPKKPGKESNLKKKIIEEMTVDYSNALGKNFDLAKRLIRITKEGKVDIPSKNKLNSKEQILLYLIGKLYAKEVGYADEEAVGSEELMNELGMVRGSLDPALKELRDAKKIKPMKKGRCKYHSIFVNLVESTLKSLEPKLKQGDGGE